MITIQELLYNRGLDRQARIKLVRHKDNRQDLYNLYRSRREEFLAYQSTQINNVFDNLDYIISFIGEESTNARFIGVWKITGKRPAPSNHVEYLMEEAGPAFDDLKERVIIRWRNPISWHQWIKNEMEVHEIRPGLNHRAFTDYFEFILDFQELQEIVTRQYSDWKRMLSATKGIYLITDSSTGKLYVGSAYGENGIWGRWCNYVAQQGHGGNKVLRQLVDSDPQYACNFRFSILQLLPSTVTPAQAIVMERLYKKKLGTNAFGLNLN